MAIRKTGTRQIVVDGAAYRWRIRRRPTSFQTDYGSGTLSLAVESANHAGAVLVLLTDRPHPKDCVPKPLNPIKPSDVASWIRLAIRTGWVPSQPGPQVHLRVSDSSAARIA